MRNMSFALTERQFLDGTKTVTRRIGWEFLRPGDKFRAVRKSMGLKKGERVEVLGVCRVVSVRREKLYKITPNDIAREGFPDCSWVDFLRFFCRKMRVTPETVITRIEFKRIA